MKCPDCRRDFPPHLIGEGFFGRRKEVKKCPICARAAINRMHGLPAETPFRGGVAGAMYAEALKHLEATNQTTRPSPKGST